MKISTSFFFTDTVTSGSARIVRLFGFLFLLGYLPDGDMFFRATRARHNPYGWADAQMWTAWVNWTKNQDTICLLVVLRNSNASCKTAWEMADEGVISHVRARAYGMELEELVTVIREELALRDAAEFDALKA